METDAVNMVNLPATPRGITGWIRLIGINLWLPLATLVETVVGIAFSPLLFLIWRVTTRWSVGRIIRHFVYLYGRIWMVLASPFVKIERVALAHQATARPCVIVINHGSLFDIFLMSVLPDFDVVIYLRAWPFKMRWYAPFMRRAEYQDIESQPWDTVETNTRQFVDAGLSIMVFPEGHRSRDGRLGRFYSGAFKLACHNRIPVVPICIQGSDRLLPPGRWWLEPTRIRVTCLDPVDPAVFTGELGHIALRKHVKSAMETCLAQN